MQSWPVSKVSWLTPQEKKKEKIKAQTDVVERQKKKIENFKATCLQLDPEKW